MHVHDKTRECRLQAGAPVGSWAEACGLQSGTMKSGWASFFFPSLKPTLVSDDTHAGPIMRFSIIFYLLEKKNRRAPAPSHGRLTVLQLEPRLPAARFISLDTLYSLSFSQPRFGRS
ncbi:hypothetical protein GQ55_3G135600 [Panicum hallii var. hallii]|uniref:Uncharacterized protein n=1 Tax=Panicum hallii var. hallii TaxID=1504633 RepID=A0A2T7E941_9POAL|nr:hypothetical protein GQ55_3G135600 [Panicum hallii var. hallii]